MEVVRHENDSGTSPCNFPYHLPERVECMQVKTVCRLIEDECFGIVYESPAAAIRLPSHPVRSLWAPTEVLIVDLREIDGIRCRVRFWLVPE